MIGLKKHDMKTTFKVGAKAKRKYRYRNSEPRYRRTLINAVNSQDPVVQKRFKKYFGNKIPTPEEYIYTINKENLSFKCLSCFLQGRSAG